MVLTELFSLNPAYPKNLYGEDILIGVQSKQLKPIPLTLEVAEYQEIIDLTNACLDFDPLKRPSFQEIEVILAAVFEKSENVTRRDTLVAVPMKLLK